MEVSNQLLNLVVCSDEIYFCMDHIHPHMSQLFKECFDHFRETLNIYSNSNNVLLLEKAIVLKLDYVFSYLHDHLNIGKWSEVPQTKRQAFGFVCFLKCCFSIRDCTKEDLRVALSYLDKGFLMGIPSSLTPTLLTDCARLVSDCIEKHNQIDLKEVKSELELSQSSPRGDLTAKRKVEDNECYYLLKGVEISDLSRPSMQEFCKKHFDKMLPAKLKDCMAHWPALKKWVDVKYILEKAGERTVPIELGSYSAENFSQRLMTIKEYIKKYYCGESEEIGYLAQHDLLTQIPDLRKDISIPEYCCISRNVDNENDSDLEPEICAWFGPKNTVSALHYDPKDNLLCQVYGTKQVILFNPSDSKYLYPHPDVLLVNTAQVDPSLPDLSSYPDFSKAKMYKCLLEAGDMLYIPPKWWHHVTALEKSFSINFWWQ